MKNFSAVAAWLLIGISVSACLRPTHISRSWTTMGTFVEIEIEDARVSLAQSAIEDVRAVFDRVDATMSVYSLNSDITRVNFAAGERPTPVDPWLAEVVLLGREAHLRTGGAFSMNVLASGIRLGLKPAEAMPSPLYEGARAGDTEIIVARDPPSVLLERKGMGLDLGGIAKGYALDQAAEALRRRGIDRFFMSLGRQVLAGDAPFGGKGWPVAIEDETVVRYIRNESISISEQGLMTDTGHIVDPRTGRPVSGARRVAVSASMGWIADMASTAVMVDPELRMSLPVHYPEIRWITMRSAEVRGAP